MKNSQAPARIMIVDDHPIVREGLTVRISAQPDLTVCGEAATEDEAVTRVAELVPDLLIVDISLDSGNGLEVIKRVKAAHPSVRMLVLSGYKESVYGERALRAGAMGYVNKQESNGKLLEAIRAILDGKRYISDDFAQRLISQSLGEAVNGKTPMELLTDRELEIFRMIGQCLRSSAIAERLFISTHTIDTHRENIKRKLNLKNAGELTSAAVQWLLENS
jgi:DNA-binding NarL/FixJ family response regulator